MAYGIGADQDWRETGARLRALRELPGLRALDRRTLRRLAATMSVLEFPPGATIRAADDGADRHLLLVDGRWDHPDGYAGPVTAPEMSPAADPADSVITALSPVRVWTLPADAVARAGAPLAHRGLPHRGLRRGARIDGEGLSQRAGGRLTLRGVSLAVAPGELVAIAGASGVGKTMLLDTLAGLRPPVEGRVGYDGVDRYAHPERFRAELGYVPQDDIIHRELPLRRTLLHAARLRLPADTPPAERDEAVRRVLDEIGLTDRSDALVGSLSGGERKRASIAVELLTRPRVFFLDEPTSGLDPATAAEVVRLLRRLADGGVTVVMTTHNVADLDACDMVAFLARGGRLAYAGPPDGACAYFGTATIDEIYERLADEDAPETWADRFAATRSPEPATDAVPTDPTDPTAAAATPATPAAEAPRPPAGSVRQWGWLTVRGAEMLVRNRLTVSLLAGSPVMILLMFVVLFRPHAFAFSRPDPNTTMMTVFWIAFGGFFFGVTYGLPLICAELSILRRERLVGVRVGAYVASKLAVLLPLLAVVDAAFLGVLQALDRLPSPGWRQDGSLFVTLLLASSAALGLGLLTSAAVSEPAQATVALPMLCFPQVLFSGAILPVPAMAAVGRAISYAMSNRWTFEALGHGADLASLWANGGSPLGRPLLASYGTTFSHAPWTDWCVLGGFTVLFLSATCLVLRARLGGSPAGRAARSSPTVTPA